LLLGCLQPFVHISFNSHDTQSSLACHRSNSSLWPSRSLSSLRELCHSLNHVHGYLSLYDHFKITFCHCRVHRSSLYIAHHTSIQVARLSSLETSFLSRNTSINHCHLSPQTRKLLTPDERSLSPLTITSLLLSSGFWQDESNYSSSPICNSTYITFCLLRISFQALRTCISQNRGLHYLRISNIGNANKVQLPLPKSKIERHLLQSWLLTNFHL